jgi:hypothetical protein
MPQHISRAHAHAARIAFGVLCACMLPVTVHAQRNAVISSIRGQVLDTLGTPVAHALVEYMDGATRIRASALADERGNFVLADVPAGQFRLRATRVGYTKVITPYWRVARGEVLSVVVRLQAEAVVLAPLEITAKTRSESPVLGGFYERADRKLGGVYIMRAEIEARAAFRITDLLATVPGIEIIRTGSDTREVRVGVAAIAPNGGACRTQIYVDGVLATRGGAVISPDDLASPGTLEGIEIYRSTAAMPPQFINPDSRCGVIALWTRRGG